MDVLKVAWTATAIKQGNYIFAYWNGRNKSNNFSRKLNQKFIERISLLKTNPELGKKTSFKTNRVLTLGHFSIFIVWLIIQYLLLQFGITVKIQKNLEISLKGIINQIVTNLISNKSIQLS